MTKNNAFLYEFFIVSEGFLLLEFKNENTHFYGKNIERICFFFIVV